MTKTIIAALVIATLGAAAQSSVLAAKNEAHHHLAYEDSSIRVLRVHVAGHDTTALHEHADDYFWLSIGNSDIVNAKVGAPDAIVRSPNLSVHFTPGKFAHVARNRAAAPFNNITVELLKSQTNAKNLCSGAVSGMAANCGTIVAHSGVTNTPLFETDQVEVGLITLSPGAFAMSGADRQWVIAIDTADTKGRLSLEGTGKWTHGVFHPTGKGGWQLKNRGSSTVRALILTAKGKF